MLIPDIKQTLHFNYWLMVASEGLLERAIQKSSGRLQSYYVHHLSEERHHAEWLRGDLEGIGVKLALDWRSAMIAGMQYYLIEHRNPSLLLGYMYALEASPKPLDVVDAVEAKYGPMRSLRYHAEHDPYHVKDLMDEIGALPDASEVELNGLLVTNEYSNVINSLEREEI